MHVKAKKIAVAGFLAAFSAVMLILSSVVKTNSLFFICAASFCVGITIREWGIRFGFAFMLASTLVNLIVVPNKLYCVTFAVMSVYILLSEILWEKIAAKKDMKHRVLMLWIGKYIIFNLIYIPVLFFFQEWLFVKEVAGVQLLVFFLGGQVALFVYDKAYVYFQSIIWGKLRGKLLKK